MENRSFSLLTLVFALIIAGSQTTARAALIWSGDVAPTDPETWTRWTTATIGDTDYGSLTLDGGSRLESRTGYIGYESGATGVVTVDGVDTNWTTNYILSVGGSGNGTLNISGGATVNDTYMSYPLYSGGIGMGRGSTGRVTVDGAGSTWTSRNGIAVGGHGSGTLEITGGGSVAGSGSFGICIGYEADSTGVVTVSGADSTLTSDNLLVVGESGSGTLNIADGGSVVVGNVTYVAIRPGVLGLDRFRGRRRHVNHANVVRGEVAVGGHRYDLRPRPAQ